MKLYTNKNGQWFGTQRDAQRGAPRNWHEVAVPTSKQDLINWLNANQVGGGYDRPVEKEPVVEVVDGEQSYDSLNKKSASWVQWALDTLIRGDRTEAIDMLKLGLKAQRGQ